MPNNSGYQWSGVLPHLRSEFDGESLQKYLTYLGITVPASLFAQVDATFYQKHYGDSLTPDDDPADFFFRHGWKLGHQPHQWFETSFYLNENGDVRDAGVNPFEHFLINGYHENRYPAAHPMNSLIEVLDLRSEKDPLNLLFRSTNQPPLANVEQMVREIKSRFFAESSHHVVAFGHDNYTSHIGGIQIVVGVEQQKFEVENTNYIFIFPSLPRLALAPSRSTPTFQLIVNGKLIPLRCELTGLFKELGDVEALIVHSIYGHDPETIAQESKTVPIKNFVWWIHDYSVHCENHLLAHNNLRSCNDPPVDSQICLTCTHGARRVEHVSRIQQLIQAAPWQFCAPSTTAQEISVAGSTRLPEPKVIPHGEITFSGSREPFDPQLRNLRIAFVGQPVPHKGWKIFRQLIDFAKIRGLPIEFFHLGSVASHDNGINYVKLAQTSSNLGLTTELLLEHNIDAVFIWSIHQETFNLVTYESMAAGCVIITRAGSGNIAAAAQEHDRSLTYDSELDLFSDERLCEKITEKVSGGLASGQFIFTGTTFALLDRVQK